jgi:hypothetical protein
MKSYQSRIQAESAMEALKQEVEDEEKYPLNEWGLRGTNLYLHQQNNIKKMEY